MDRRSFMSSLSVLGAGAALTHSDRLVIGEELTAATPRVPTSPRTNIAVKSRYAPIAPFDTDVYAQRLERARQVTRDAGATTLLATSGATNFRYLVGSNYGRSERLIALLVPVDGAPLLIAPSFEVERVRRGSRIDAPVRGWEEQADPFALVRDAMRETGGATAILVEPKTDYWTAMAVSRALPDAKLVDGTAAFEQTHAGLFPAKLVALADGLTLTRPEPVAGNFTMNRDFVFRAVEFNFNAIGFASSTANHGDGAIVFQTLHMQIRHRIG